MTFQGGYRAEYPCLVVNENNDGFAFHYALVRDNQKILEKLLWQYEMIERRWGNENERNSCRTFGKNVLDFKLNTHVWFLAHQPDLSMMVREYGGRHPDVMYNNKWADYRWDMKPVKLSYKEALKLVGHPGDC